VFYAWLTAPRNRAYETLHTTRLQNASQKSSQFGRTYFEESLPP